MQDAEQPSAVRRRQGRLCAVILPFALGGVYTGSVENLRCDVFER
ncbi:hypothetical protein [uncultured Deinococcus sp.]|nr:hypothetical protein [uncultured Deinococcus sp.]